jgi:hypothetical protein
MGKPENFVTQKFLCFGVDELFSWRQGTSEVEFLREIHGKVVAAEIPQKIFFL